MGEKKKKISYTTVCIEAWQNHQSTGRPQVTMGMPSKISIVRGKYRVGPLLSLA